MKIVLVQPPWVQVPGRFGETPPDAPMGHAYLAAYARERFGDAVSLRILDAVAEGLSEEGTRRAIVTEKPAIVGYTNVTATAPVVKRLALGVRDAVPDIVQIAGGPHASVVPGDMIGPLDLAVRGEGEHTFAEIVERRLAGTNDWSGIAGTSYLRGGEPFDEPSRPYVKNLDELPFPARDLLPMHAYSHEYPTRARNRRFVTFFTARGCPWDCSFCCKHQVWGRYARFRTLDNVFAELEFYAPGTIPDSSFYDDTFTVNRKRVMEFCARLRAGGFDFQWACLTRADCLDDDLVRTMKDAGCRELQLGVESGSDDVLEAIRKKMTVDDLHRAFAMLRKHELRTKAFFILGHYHDRAEHLKRTMDLAVRLDPTWVFFSVMVPFPGTEDFRVAKERGFLETDDWERFNIHGKPILHTEHLSAAELGLARSRAYRRFYLRPRKVLRYLRDMIAAGDVRRMWGNFRAFLDLAGRAKAPV